MRLTLLCRDISWELLVNLLVNQIFVFVVPSTSVIQFAHCSNKMQISRPGTQLDREVFQLRFQATIRRGKNS